MILVYGADIFRNKVQGFLVATGALITENLEGECYCELECQNTADNSKYFKKDTIITVTGQNGGTFRIGEPIKTLGKLKAKCYSLFYDTENYIISSLSLLMTSIPKALEAIKNACDTLPPFELLTDFPEDIKVTLDFENVTLKEALEKLKEQVGGHYTSDGTQIVLRQSIGKNNGTVLRYAENIKSFTITENWSEVCTKLKAIMKLNETTYETWLESEVQYDVPYTKIIEFDPPSVFGDLGELNIPSMTPAAVYVEFKKRAEEYLTAHLKPAVNYNIEAHITSPAHIGDICQVIYPKLSVNEELQITETKWDGVSQRYEAIQFGTPLPSINGLYSRLGGK